MSSMNPQNAPSGRDHNTSPQTMDSHFRTLSSYPSTSSSLRGVVVSGTASGARTPKTPGTMDENAPLLDHIHVDMEQGTVTPQEYGGTSGPGECRFAHLYT